MDVSELKLLAGDGDSVAQLELGQIYRFGIGDIEVDEAEALSWYLLSAERGNVDAQRDLGRLDFMGECGASKDEAEALKWCRLAAAQGNADAQEQIGLYHRLGLGGFSKNDSEAIKWYQLAGEGGNPLAAETVGDFYYLGRGVAKNEKESLAWYEKAIALNNSEKKGRVIDEDGRVSHAMQKALGDFWFLGLNGSSVDKMEGLKWYARAAVRGNEVAGQRLLDYDNEQEQLLQAALSKQRHRRWFFVFIATLAIAAISVAALGLFPQRDVTPQVGSTESNSHVVASGASPPAIIPSPVQNDGINQIPPSAKVQLGSNAQDIATQYILESPIQVCESESNFFSKNNCRWNQCAKEENKTRTECDSFRKKMTRIRRACVTLWTERYSPTNQSKTATKVS